MICRLSWMSIRISLCLSFYGNIAAGKDNIFVTACTIIVMKLPPWILPLHIKSRNDLDPCNNSTCNNVFIMLYWNINDTKRKGLNNYLPITDSILANEVKIYRYRILHLEVFASHCEFWLRACWEWFFFKIFLFCVPCDLSLFHHEKHKPNTCTELLLRIVCCYLAINWSMETPTY